MISLLHLPILVVCSFTLVGMYRFWACIDRMGFTREVSKRSPSLIHGDLLAAAGAITPFFLAAIDWSGFTFPGHPEPAPSIVIALCSLGCMGVCIHMLRNADGRIAGHWEGSRESAIRTLAALRIIDAAELTYAMKKVNENDNRAGQVIEVQVQEVEK